MTPLHNKAVIKPDEAARTTASGIVLVNQDDRPTTGTVVVGNSDVKEGQKVLFSRYGFDETKIDGETLYVVSDKHILAIIN